MRRQALTITVAATLLILSIAACSSDTSPPAAEENSPTTTVRESPAADKPAVSLTSKDNTVQAAGCAQILNARCAACHHATRICQKLGRKNTKGWKRTISNMVRHGAQISSAETDTLVRCLDLQMEEVQQYCQ